MTPVKKKSAIRRTAVRETGVSRHHIGVQLRAPLKPPIHHRAVYRIGGFKGGPHMGPHYAESPNLVQSFNFKFGPKLHRKIAPKLRRKLLHYTLGPGWNFSYRLSERLVFLAILRPPPLHSLGIILLWCSGAFQGGPQLAANDAERSYASRHHSHDRCRISRTVLDILHRSGL